MRIIKMIREVSIKMNLSIMLAMAKMLILQDYYPLVGHLRLRTVILSTAVERCLRIHSHKRKTVLLHMSNKWMCLIMITCHSKRWVSVNKSGRAWSRVTSQLPASTKINFRCICLILLSEIRIYRTQVMKSHSWSISQIIEGTAGSMKNYTKWMSSIPNQYSTKINWRNDWSKIWRKSFWCMTQ